MRKLKPIEVLALQKMKIKEPVEGIEPGMYPVDFEVKVLGIVEVNADEEYTPTASIPLLPTLALFMKNSGATGPGSLKILIKSMKEALALGENASDVLKDIPGVAECLHQVECEMYANLEPVKRKGKVYARLQVTPV